MANVVAAAVSRPYLGPWMATTRIWQPRPLRVLANSWKEAGPNLDSFSPNLTPSRPRSPAPRNSLPGLSSDFDIGKSQPRLLAGDHQNRNPCPSHGVGLVKMGK